MAEKQTIEEQITGIIILVLMIGMVYGLYSCVASGGSAPAARRQVTDGELIYQTKRGLEARLKDADSADYRNVKVYHHSDRMVVCGEVNAKNSFGALTGYQPFAGLGDLVVMQGDMASGEFTKFWTQYCR